MLQAFIGECGVDASATLQLRMLRFVNPGGKDIDGVCCDKTLWWCSGACDHHFRFALDRGNRYTRAKCYLVIVGIVDHTLLRTP